MDFIISTKKKEKAFKSTKYMKPKQRLIVKKGYGGLVVFK